MYMYFEPPKNVNCAVRVVYAYTVTYVCAWIISNIPTVRNKKNLSYRCVETVSHR